MIGTLLKFLPWSFLMILPLIEASVFAYVLRGSLPRPWWFVGASSIAIYLVLGFFAFRELSGVGVTGVPSSESTANGLVGVGVAVAYLVLTAAAIWGFSFLFRRTA